MKDFTGKRTVPLKNTISDALNRYSKMLCFQSWKCSKKHVVTWFSGEYGGGAGITVGLDLKTFSYINDSMVL